MRRFMNIIALLLLVSFLAGCGETVHGMATDTRRIGKGVKKVFVRD